MCSREQSSVRQLKGAYRHFLFHPPFYLILSAYCISRVRSNPKHVTAYLLKGGAKIPLSPPSYPTLPQSLHDGLHLTVIESRCSLKKDKHNVNTYSGSWDENRNIYVENMAFDTRFSELQILEKLRWHTIVLSALTFALSTHTSGRSTLQRKATAVSFVENCSENTQQRIFESPGASVATERHPPSCSVGSGVNTEDCSRYRQYTCLLRRHRQTAPWRKRS